jgi:hypothetical protein
VKPTNQVTRALQAKIGIAQWEKIFRKIKQTSKHTTSFVLTDNASTITPIEADGLEEFIELSFPNLQCCVLHRELTKGNTCIKPKQR